MPSLVIVPYNALGQPKHLFYSTADKSQDDLKNSLKMGSLHLIDFLIRATVCLAVVTVGLTKIDVSHCVVMNTKILPAVQMMEV